MYERYRCIAKDRSFIEASRTAGNRAEGIDDTVVESADELSNRNGTNFGGGGAFRMGNVASLSPPADLTDSSSGDSSKLGFSDDVEDTEPDFSRPIVLKSVDNEDSLVDEFIVERDDIVDENESEFGRVFIGPDEVEGLPSADNGKTVDMRKSELSAPESTT